MLVRALVVGSPALRTREHAHIPVGQIHSCVYGSLRDDTPELTRSCASSGYVSLRRSKALRRIEERNCSTSARPSCSKARNTPRGSKTHTPLKSARTTKPSRASSGTDAETAFDREPGSFHSLAAAVRTARDIWDMSNGMSSEAPLPGHAQARRVGSAWDSIALRLIALAALQAPR